MRPRFLIAATVAVSLCGSLQSEAQDGTNVLVIANGANRASVQIAEEYAAARAVPTDQLLRLKITNGEQLSRADFEQQIQSPVAAWLAAHGLQDRILYIVLTKGVPLQISGSSGRQGSSASVDSELALLYRRLTGVSVPANGPVPNPYFARTAEDIKSAKPFNRATYDTYLVTRLDGFTVADALGLITRGLAPRQDGRILMDAPLVTGDPRVGWMDEAASRLREGGFADRVVVENTGRALQNEADVLGYMSWGSNDPALNVRHPNLTFVPGAVASMFLSSDARTFVEPPSSWKPGPALPQNSYSGSSQTLTGDLIRSGITGVAGQVSEPYVDGAVRPDILFPAYLKGLNLAEAFYLATPSLSWQAVVIGDPLCAPFRTAAFGESQPDPPVDADTELPAHFSARRLATLQGRATAPALKLMLRAETRDARGDSEGALDALKKATTADSASTFVWHALAIAHERRGDHAEAAGDYRQILALNATDVVALNNLAYNLTVHDNRPREGYVYAARAAALTRNPTIDDTLGWIQHLLGDNTQALVLLDRASRSLPNNAEVQFHAAVVYAATGRVHEAEQLLKAALALDPSFGHRRDVRDLQQTLRPKY